MEESWFEVICDTLGLAGNIAECIGLVFFFSQLRHPARVPLKRRKYDRQQH